MGGGNEEREMRKRELGRGWGVCQLYVLGFFFHINIWKINLFNPGSILFYSQGFYIF